MFTSVPLLSTAIWHADVLISSLDSLLLSDETKNQYHSFAAKRLQLIIQICFWCLYWNIIIKKSSVKSISKSTSESLICVFVFLVIVLVHFAGGVNTSSSTKSTISSVYHADCQWFHLFMSCYGTSACIHCKSLLQRSWALWLYRFLK